MFCPAQMVVDEEGPYIVVSVISPHSTSCRSQGACFMIDHLARHLRERGFTIDRIVTELDTKFGRRGIGISLQTLTSATIHSCFAADDESSKKMGAWGDMLAARLRLPELGTSHVELMCSDSSTEGVARAYHPSDHGDRPEGVEHCQFCSSTGQYKPMTSDMVRADGLCV
jgi:hypothetical protein